MAKGSERPFLRAEALEVFGEVNSALLNTGAVHEAIPCGSIRRGKQIVNDVDVVVISECHCANKIWEALMQQLPGTKKIVQGEKEFRIVYKGLQFDLRNFIPQHKGAALIFSTGSAQFNIVMRSKAKMIGRSKGQVWKMNRYGINKVDPAVGEFNMTAGFTEEKIFEFLGMNFIQPENRHENKIELGMKARMIPVISSDGATIYDVLFKGGQLFCPCEGFKYRRKCRHIDEARRSI